MKKTFLLLSILSAFVLLSAFSFPGKKAKKKESIKWYTLEEVEKLSKKEPRKIMVDIYTDWCGYCKKMDRTTYKNKAVVEYINKNYYPVKLNAEMKENVTFAGTEYKYMKQGRRGAHELAILMLEGRLSFPSTVVLDNDFSKLTIVPGYVDAKKLDTILRYFGDGYHDKGIKWNIFNKNFKSRVR